MGGGDAIRCQSERAMVCGWQFLHPQALKQTFFNCNSNGPPRDSGHLFDRRCPKSPFFYVHPLGLFLPAGHQANKKA